DGDRFFDAARALPVQPESLRHVVHDDRCGRVDVGRRFRGRIEAQRAHSSSLTRPANRRKIAQPIAALAIETTNKPPSRAASGTCRLYTTSRMAATNCVSGFKRTMSRIGAGALSSTNCIVYTIGVA